MIQRMTAIQVVAKGVWGRGTGRGLRGLGTCGRLKSFAVSLGVGWTRIFGHDRRMSGGSWI